MKDKHIITAAFLVMLLFFIIEASVIIGIVVAVVHFVRKLW